MTQVILVSNRQEMAEAINLALGRASRYEDTSLSFSPEHYIEIGEVIIERDVRETSFYGCNHAVSTDRFCGETDWCAVCSEMRAVR